MCGIALHVDYSSQAGSERLRQMVHAIRHRGPDGEGIHSTPLSYGTLHLGHRLLQIIDPSDQNRQPLFSQDGRYALVFNGEIYNFRSLRNQLATSGQPFRTNGDTEVLLHWLIQKGIEGLALLNGMFALIFTDLQTGDVLMARDRFGVKPVFYSSLPQHFLACSEIKGLLASGLLSKEPDPKQINHYLRYRHVLKPGTIFKGILELEEGHYLTISGSGEIGTPTPFYTDLPGGPGHQNPSSLRELLFEAVDRQLTSDVPVGIFLSGGLDSTLLLAIMRELGYHEIPSFVIHPSDDPGSFGSEDAAFATQAARQYGGKLHRVPVTGDMVINLTEAVSMLDQPVADSAFLMTSLLSREAVKSVGVVLSGAGADEWFGGYHRHLAARKAIRIGKLLGKKVSLLHQLARILPDGADHPFRKKTRLARKFLAGIHSDPKMTADAFRSLQVGKSVPSNSWPESQPFLDNILWQDRHHYLISDILSISDQTSMAHGLELRTPYLDNALAQYCLTQGAGTLLSKGRKWMLARELAALGGQAYCDRPKAGLGLPVGHWLQKPDSQEFLQQLTPAAHPLFEWIPKTLVQTLFESHVRRKQDLSSEILAIIILFSWWNHNFGE